MVTSLSDNRGFTLVEVLVALVIALMALGALFVGVASSLRTAHETALWGRAIEMAESRVAAIVDPASALGEHDGKASDGFRWHTSVAFISATPAPNAARGGIWAHGTGLYAVSVTVLWQDGEAEQRFKLDSAMLGPVSGYAQ